MIHHLAITPKDFAKSHQFYTEVMGFALVKIVKRQAMGGEKAGWTKHVFYDTGAGSYFVMWDLHLSDFTPDENWNPAISLGIGLPWWINHIAFEVKDLDELEAEKAALAGQRPQGQRSRPRIHHVDLHEGPRRQHGRVHDQHASID